MVSAQLCKAFFVLVIASGALARDDKGLLHLDSLTFDKVVGGNHDMLVRFDREYSVSRVLYRFNVKNLHRK
jgi:hypothetical protein